MSLVFNQARSARAATGSSIGRAVSWALMGLLLAVLVGYIALDMWNPTRLHASQGRDGRAAAEAKSAPESKAAPPAGTSVTLSESKFQRAKIATEPARVERLATELGVVGMIQANAERQVEIRPRASGIVREVHVRLGQKVKRGESLVILDSPEVGKARLDLRARQRELATARYEARWKSEIAENVKALIPELQKGIAEHIANRRDPALKERHHGESQDGPGLPTRTEAIEMKFVGKDLGAYRGTLLQAFAEYEIAVHEEEKNISLQRQNIVGAHPVVVAQHTREGMQAKLTGAIEQARYDSAQERRVADQAMRLAEAAVVDAAQRLRILGVTEDIPHLLAHPEEASKLAMTEDVTRYQIDAPFDGNIIKKHEFAAPSQKADMNDVLLVLADLRTVWVKADIPEWRIAELARIRDGAIRFRATAYPGREFPARLISVGSAVDPQTRTVPILAETENLDGLLKVGMFVNILLGSSSVEEALTVPTSAIVEIDAAKYVFIPADQPRTFRPRPVEVGRQAGGRTVVRSGLVAGETVVASGAFFLKSELILQNSSDDE